MSRTLEVFPRTRESLLDARGNAFALFRAADRLGICVQRDVQMNPVKNKAERSHTLPRELWPILALISTGPVLFVNVLLGGDRALRSEEHTSELQSLTNLVCRLLLEKK